MLGDLNIDLLKCNSCPKAAEYIDTLFTFGFLQTFTKPTRCTSTSATLIDHCITNVLTLCHTSTILTCSLSDHFPILYTNSSLTKAFAPIKNIQSRDFSTENLNKFRETLSNINWNTVTGIECPQEAYNIFSNTFNNFYELYFPLTSKRPNKNFIKIEPWCTNGILVSRRNKLKLSCLASSKPTADNINSFKIYRNVYNRVIKHAKKLYYECELLRHQSDLKKTWSLICTAIKRVPKNKNVNLSFLQHNNCEITDPAEMASLLNELLRLRV